MSHSMHQPQQDGTSPEYGQPQPYGQPHAQPPGQSYGPPQHGHRAAGPMRNGLGVAALVLGVLGLITGPIPLIFWLGGTLALLALIFGLVGRGRAKRGEASNKGVATAGAVLGLLGMIGATIGAAITIMAVDDAVDEINKATTPASASKEPGSGSDAGSDKTKGKKGKGKSKGGSGGGGGSSELLAAGDTAAYKDGVKVTMSAATSYKVDEYTVGHTKGNKAYQVTVTLENTGDKKFDATLTTVDARAGEDGVTAEQIFDGDVGPGFTGTVLPGKKATVVYAFDAPADAKTLTVELSPGFMHDGSQWELTL
ncbi:DUF4190 domain-containing protein [Streptomyces sp. CAU 1734]|uniref:DUF4190 domain-containing protein n=1 Tax=Streptomyces sp. CAU 1734 TaxID=3140360 RepID=UPI003261A2C7